MKQALENYQKVKSNHCFLGKRDRVIKGGWIHGITGIENVAVEAPNATQSIFYREVLDKKVIQLREREAINRRRQKSKSSKD